MRNYEELRCDWFWFVEGKGGIFVSGTALGKGWNGSKGSTWVE